jgi:hypothetical protein
LSVLDEIVGHELSQLVDLAGMNDFTHLRLDAAALEDELARQVGNFGFLERRYQSLIEDSALVVSRRNAQIRRVNTSQAGTGPPSRLADQLIPIVPRFELARQRQSIILEADLHALAVNWVRLIRLSGND